MEDDLDRIALTLYRQTTETKLQAHCMALTQVSS